MSRFLKISLTVLALVVAILVLLVIRVATLDPNDYKDWIADRVEEQTGRTLTLGGNIELTLYPWLGLGVEQVVLTDRAGFSEQPLLQADAARIRLKLLPLLRQRYEIDTVQLRGVRVNLLVDEAGNSNWADLVGGESAESSAPAAGDGLPLTRFVIGGVEVSDVGLRYEDRRSGAVYQLDDLTFTIGELTYGTPIELAMSLTAATNQPGLAADAQLTGTVNYDLAAGRYQLAPLTLQARLTGDTLPGTGADLQMSTALGVDLGDDSLSVSELTLTGLGTRLLASVEGQGISSSRPRYRGQIDLDGDDLAVLFRTAGVAELASRLAQLQERQFALTADLAYTGDNAGGVEFTRLDATLPGARIETEGQATGLQSDAPQVTGRVNASGPDLPLLVEVLGQLSGGADSPLARTGRDLRQASARDFDVAVELDANLGTGTLAIPVLSARLLGASVNGVLSATAIESDTPSVAGNLSARGPDLPRLLRLAGSVQGADSPLLPIAESLIEDGDGAFRVDTRFDVHLEQGDFAVPALSVSALGWDLTGELDARAMSGRTGRITGALSLQGRAPAPLLAALGQAGLADVVDRVTVELAVSGTRQNLEISPLEASIVVAGPRIPNSPVTLSLDAASRLDLERETMTMENFAVNGLGLDASGSLSAERLFDEPAYQGRLALSEFDLRGFLQQLNQPVPATNDPDVLRRVGVEALIDGSTNRIALEELRLVLDDTSLTGNLSIDSVDPPSAGFALEIDRFDADRYLPPAQTQAATAPGGDAPGELPVEQLRELTLLGELQVGELTVAGLNLQGVSLTVNATGGDLNLAPLAAELYRGSFEGAAELSVNGPEPRVSLDANLRGVDLEPLLADLLDATYLTGRGTVRLNLQGTGTDREALQRTLNGNGWLELENGVLNGVDVAAVLRQLETMIRRRQAAVLERGSQTAFDSFSGTLSIVNGVVTTNDILIQSPGFRVSGRGTLLNLVDNSIAFDLLTEVDRATATVAAETYDIGGYSLPIACTGTLNTPRCIPDAGEILRARVQQELQNRVLDLLDRSLGGGTDAATSQDSAASAPATTADPASSTGIQAPAPTQPQTQPEDLRDQVINRVLERLINQ